MATIGIFTKQENGEFIGTLQSLTSSARLTFEPLARRGEKSPDFRITCGLYEYGAAWKCTTENGEYLSVQLDDPSFAAPINCRLIKTGTTHTYSLIWERPRKSA